MSRVHIIAAAVVALAVVGLVACESTQDKSAEIEAGSGELLEQEGFEVTEESGTVEVLSSTVLTDQYGTAVAVELRNNSNETLTNVPVALDVKDAQGKSVYTNEIEGLDQTLTSVPVIEAGEETVWVNDEILANGEPKSVHVTVGESTEEPPPEVPPVEVSEPQVRTDPVSGVEATGTVTNESGEDLQFVYLYGVAKEGDQIVAAGRGLIDRLRTEAKPSYHVFFIGDPEGAEVTVGPAPTFNYEGP
jgi:hypothetical protein